MTQDKWSKPSIIAALREARRHGADLSMGQMEMTNPAVARAARHHFGSYSKAVEALGVNYADVRRRRPWSAEQVLEELRARQSRGEGLSGGKVATDDRR